MDEDQNSSVNEIAPQDHEANVVESSEPPVPTPVVKQEEDKQERNWKELRNKQYEAEARIKAQEEMIERLLRAQTPVQQPVAQPDELAEVSDDDFLTKKQTSKAIQKHAEAIAERKYKQMEAERENSRFLERLKSEYSDFTDIVTPDSIAIFEQKQPKLAGTIAELKDPYKMGLQTYHYLKAMKIPDEVQESRHSKEVEKKLDKNEKTVQSPQAYNKRPMAQAFRMTDSEKKALYEEMMSHAAQAGSVY